MCSTTLELTATVQLFFSLHPSRRDPARLAALGQSGSPQESSFQEDQETEWGGTVPGRMLAGAARGAKLVILSHGRHLIKDRGRFVTHGINKVSSRFSQGENQREKYLPCVSQ